MDDIYCNGGITMNAQDFFKTNNFKKNYLPVGETRIYLDSLDIETIEVKYNNKNINRYKIKFIDENKIHQEYEVGIQVIRLMEDIIPTNPKYIRILKTGEGLETNYSLINEQNIC